MAEEIARLTTVWDANFQKLDEKLNKVIRSHYGAANKIKKDADSFTRQLEQRYGRVGQAMGNVFNDSRLATIQAGAGHLRVFGSALEPLGVAGLAAAAGVAALAVAGQQAISAMRFADEIDDAAQKLAIGTDALQEFRFAMTEVGGEAKDADTAIKEFNRVLGEAQSGLSPRAMKGFAALGFTREQIQSFNSGEDALEDVARRVAALSKESEQAAVAEKLGLGTMLPLLREGADGMEALRQKARDLGIVMDADLVKKGADANQQFETMASVIKVQLTSAFVELSDEVVAFTGHIADALKGLNDFLEKFSSWKTRLDAMYGPGTAEDMLSGNSGQFLARVVRGTVSGRAAAVGEAYNSPASDPDDPALLRQRMAVEAANSNRVTGTGRLTPPASRSSGRANREAEQRRRREEQFERQLERVQMELIRAYDSEFESIGADAGSKLIQLRHEHEAALREIIAAEEEYARSNGLRGLSKTEADQLRAAQEELRGKKAEQIEWEERRDLEAYRLKLSEDAAQAALDLLGVERDLALTAKDRHEVERRILAATLEMERNREKADLANDPNIDDEERARRLAVGDRGRQAVYDQHSRESPGGGMARDVAAGILSAAFDPEEFEDALSEIARLEEEGVLSHQQAMEARAEIDAMYFEKRIGRERGMLDTLAGMQSSSIKELAAIGKAAAIAQATIDGYVAIQKAWASAPFPMNLPAVAITTAATAANVAAIAGFERGGYTGNAGTKQVAGVVHGQEYVFDAAATRRIGVPALEALRAGSDLISGLNGASAAGMSSAAAPSVTYAPTIDARGADLAAVSRLEEVMAAERRAFASNVKGVIRRAEKYRLGGKRK